MEKMTIVIADDDLTSIKLLSRFIQLLPEYSIVGQASNGEELIKLVMSEQPNIILVDIDMPGIDGVNAAKTCKELFPSLQVIFTTGHDEYAVEAFTLSAADYVVKPIERTRLNNALKKAKFAIELDKGPIEAVSSILQNKLAFKSKNAIFYLVPDDIFFIKKEGTKTLIYTENDEIETTDSLLVLEERLPSYFYKTHRSFIVNLKRVARIESVGETYHAYFDGCEQIAFISKLKISEVYKMFGAN